MQIAICDDEKVYRIDIRRKIKKLLPDVVIEKNIYLVMN